MIEDKGYSFPSDVWSTGVLLYECLTYFHPFQVFSFSFLFSEGVVSSGFFLVAPLRTERAASTGCFELREFVPQPPTGSNADVSVKCDAATLQALLIK